MNESIIYDRINAFGLEEITERDRDGRKFRVTLEHVVDGSVVSTGSIVVTIANNGRWLDGDDVIPQVLASVEAESVIVWRMTAAS